ncbi:MAG: maleylpyruvate isomerase family mycothiol-dependent enzyme, partial [Mycobacteriaceae bacterium]
MTDLQSWVAPTYNGLADLRTATPVDTWDSPSLCEKWLVRHVIAHVTMPARLTPAQFGAEMAAARGDFTVLSDTVATRDASLPVAELLDQLRSPRLHAWQPPGGGGAGALSHAVIHSLDVTIALDRPTVAPPEAATTVLDQLTAASGS